MHGTSLHTKGHAHDGRDVFPDGAGVIGAVAAHPRGIGHGDLERTGVSLGDGSDSRARLLGNRNGSVFCVCGGFRQHVDPFFAQSGEGVGGRRDVDGNSLAHQIADALGDPVDQFNVFAADQNGLTRGPAGADQGPSDPIAGLLAVRLQHAQADGLAGDVLGF